MSTVREIAKIACVSASTVSRVLNATAPVNEETRNAVLAAMDQLHYIPKRRTGKSAKKAAHIAIIMPRDSAANLSEHPTIYSIMSSFVSYLEAHGISNSIVTLDELHVKKAADLLTGPADGYLVLCTSMHQEDLLLPYLTTEKIPYVIVNRWVQQKHCNYVNIDDVSASSTAVEWLIAHGHDRIAFIGGDADYRSTQLRMRGYRLALEAHGLPVREDAIITGDYSTSFGCQAADALMKLPHRPTAGFFASDTLAIGAIRRMTEKGWRIPEDFSVLGYGDIAIASLIQPPITTIHIPEEDMGIQAARALMNLIDNPVVSNIQVLLEASLIIRKSCVSLKPTEARGGAMQSGK